MNFGILPLTFASEADYDALASGSEIEIAGIRAALEAGSDLTLVDRKSGRRVALKYALSNRQRAILLAGGMLNYTKMQSK